MRGRIKKLFLNSALLFIVPSCFNLSCRGTDDGVKDLRFVLLDAESHGINHKNSLIYSEEFNVYLYKSFYNGAGVGAGDLNNDGLVDLVFTTNQSGIKLYLNKGNLQFSDVTDQSSIGAHSTSWYTGVSIVDVNADGMPDVFLCKAGQVADKNRHNELWINLGTDSEGIPKFVESAEAFGVADIGLSVHAVFFDYDRDNDLDFYLLTNSISPSDAIIDARLGMRDKRDPNGNKLYRNDDGHFTDVTIASGIYSSSIGFGLGASVGDLNRDGWPDLYVANDFFEKDYLYLNQGNGTFKEDIERSTTEISLGAMGVDIGDMNNDGWPEIFVTEMLPRDQRRLKTKTVFDGWDTYRLKVQNGYSKQFSRNSFQLNNGRVGRGSQVSFSEISRYADVAATDWSWATLIADFDNDGLTDIFVTNGIVKDLLDQDYIDFYTNPERLRAIYAEKGAVIKQLIDSIPSEPIPNFFFHQEKDFKFKDVTTDWGLAQPGFSNGVAYADLDNDGDLDLVVSNIDDHPFLYENRSDTLSGDRNFLSLKLRGADGNSSAIGAQVTLKTPGKIFFQELFPMRGTMSTVDSRLHFGLGSITTIDTLEIVWPDHVKTIRLNVNVNQLLAIEQEKESPLRYRDSSSIVPLFHPRSVGTFAAARHVENESNDFNYDVLMPFMVSNTGPPMAANDINHDGLTDFYLGGAMNQAGSLLIQNKSGQFSKMAVEDFEKDKTSEDTDAVFMDVDGDGDDDLLVASGSYEFSPNSFALANRIYINKGGNFKRSPQVYPANRLGNTSVIKPSDVDNDGDLDLFVGSYCKPQQYGLEEDSYLLINNGKGIFQDETNTIAPQLRALGLVTDAVWMDYDHDGDDDLFVVGHWMPVKAFQNNGGKLTDVSEKIRLGENPGLWTTIEQNDLDNDGHPDLVCGNLGLNSTLKASKEKPLRLYTHDFDNNGTLDNIITAFNGEHAYPIATKKELVARLPYLRKKFLKYEDYALATIEDIFSAEQIEAAKVKSISTLSSCILWNVNGSFTKEDLPNEAQLSPIYAVLVDDFDGDGVKEIVSGGNQYLAKPQLGINGASYGLVMQVNGKGKIRVLSQIKSGIHVSGQVRSIVKIDGPTSVKSILFGICDDSVRVFDVNKKNKIQ